MTATPTAPNPTVPTATALVLEIDYLLGVAFAASGPEAGQPDWPPQPPRVFSALVASWAARGRRPEETAALEWLEKQPTPRIVASGHIARSAPVRFVPPNDAESGRSGDKAVLPSLRSRQPRRFPATRPFDSKVSLHWSDTDPDDGTMAALEALAADTAYVGHSTSLTRCRFLREDGALPENARWPALTIYPGRLDELRRAYDAKQRPGPGNPFKPPAAPRGETVGVFADRWLLLEHVVSKTGGTEMPDLRAAALVAKKIHKTLLHGYGEIGRHGDAIPEMVSGHQPDGRPSRAPHIAIVPMSFTGFPHADGHALGFAVIPPRGSNLFDDPEFLKALRMVAPVDPDSERRLMRLDGFDLTFAPTFDPPENRRSLDPALYTAAATTFATVTPIVLDRHLKERGEARQREITDQIAAACRNAGLPEPVDVVPDKHSALEGAPSAYPSSNAPAWMRWKLPDALASRQLTHAVIRFPKPVRGPVLLGAGRFLGLGLCRPLDSREERS
ncbi:CRISPR-associated protein Csb2 [Azospirillum lipoferum]|uniref:Type I-U CRISPR-associated protein Cas5/Cas6 n=1 Tax=Azospirillum lipoferum TaxID=193 RepID=A0A5A9GQQ6_AZOLI|nr:MULTISPECIES: type I-U CRISPR-associated protein Csb2 [Azospirillum]KAA0596115.1 type I-U CRISPR-associated protein Cas5/Cas6 [Azospirillum lipoferum]MCP1611062.1 CRISPR-associated protein Csb2 [Azospirillum lipoferum]MDW5533810.1 type I-U CRISPR-associated protein Csb2 [Azospirillum sp. NL1]